MLISSFSLVHTPNRRTLQPFTTAHTSNRHTQFGQLTFAELFFQPAEIVIHVLQARFLLLQQNRNVFIANFRRSPINTTNMVIGQRSHLPATTRAAPSAVSVSIPVPTSVSARKCSQDQCDDHETFTPWNGTQRS
eukprot:COSAG02_NODE_187_length_30377_cov_3.636271_6_plen_135_part_00